jgi:hypothetical protein
MEELGLKDQDNGLNRCFTHYCLLSLKCMRVNPTQDLSFENKQKEMIISFLPDDSYHKINSTLNSRYKIAKMKSKPSLLSELQSFSQVNYS